jgi:hypothetical protein
VRRHLVLLAVAAVATLAACGGSDSASKHTTHAGSLTASDHSFSLKAPKGWNRLPKVEQPPIVLVAQGSNQVEQLIVDAFAGKDEAESNATYTVAGLSGSGAQCKRTKLESKLVFDCGGTYQGAAYRKLFFPIAHGDRSYLVLVQVPAKTLAEAAKVAAPIVQSMMFE